MAAPKLKTSVMTEFGQRDRIIKQFGTTARFYQICKPYIAGIVPDSQAAFAKIIAGEACTPEQSAIVEHCIREFLYRPSDVITRWHKEWLENPHQETYTLSREEMYALQGASGFTT